MARTESGFSMSFAERMQCLGWASVSFIGQKNDEEESKEDEEDKQEK